MGRSILTHGLLALTLLVGCGTAEREADARQAAEAYFQAVKDRNPDRAVSFYAKRFFETRSPEGWKQDLKLIAERLGTLQSHSLKSWSSRTDFVPPDSGSYVTLHYEVKYARHTATETLTLHKPFARGEYRIVDHRISSEGFLRE
jgi:hypothetical protein